ncbi:MAG TPA: hypothetical protein VGC62_03885 [Pseudomonas sp.]|uniref:hypothetical protein n=1 Tax=Pseudomonas sp. TaxID=306 RepID=UPI002EDB7256
MLGSAIFIASDLSASTQGTDDGQIIIIHNPGMWRLNESGLVKQGQGLQLKDMKEIDLLPHDTVLQNPAGRIRLVEMATSSWV